MGFWIFGPPRLKEALFRCPNCYRAPIAFGKRRSPIGSPPGFVIPFFKWGSVNGLKEFKKLGSREDRIIILGFPFSLIKMKIGNLISLFP